MHDAHRCPRYHWRVVHPARLPVRAAAALIALGALSAACGSDAPPADLAAAAGTGGCDPAQGPDEEGFEHVEPGTTVRYGTSPPTSGPHYGAGAPTFTGVHEEPIPNEVQVHNLEHGHVGIQYRPGLDPALVEELGRVTRSDPQWIFMAPYPDLPAGVQVAFTAWTALMHCSEPTEDIGEAASAFVEAFRDRSRESIPGTPR